MDSSLLVTTAERNLPVLDNCFHLLDGRGVAKYPEDAVIKINEAIGDNQ